MAQRRARADDIWPFGQEGQKSSDSQGDGHQSKEERNYFYPVFFSVADPYFPSLWPLCALRETGVCPCPFFQCG